MTAEKSLQTLSDVCTDYMTHRQTLKTPLNQQIPEAEKRVCEMMAWLSFLELVSSFL